MAFYIPPPVWHPSHDIFQNIDYTYIAAGLIWNWQKLKFYRLPSKSMFLLFFKKTMSLGPTTVQAFHFPTKPKYQNLTFWFAWQLVGKGAEGTFCQRAPG